MLALLLLSSQALSCHLCFNSWVLTAYIPHTVLALLLLSSQALSCHLCFNSWVLYSIYTTHWSLEFQHTQLSSQTLLKLISVSLTACTSDSIYIPPLYFSLCMCVCWGWRWCGGGGLMQLLCHSIIPTVFSLCVFIRGPFLSFVF